VGVQLSGAEPRWISVNSRPLYDPDSSKPSAVIATFADITAERQLNQNLRKARADLRAILDNVPGMIGYWNRELRCEFANRAYFDWFDLPPERAVGLHMTELLGERLFNLNEPYARLALQGHAQRFERRLVKIDGSPSCTDARYIPDVDESGTVRGFYVLVTDITELRESYAQVRALAQRLEVVREDERRSIARSLHEGIAQDLFAAKLTLEHLKAHAPDGAVPGWTDLGDAIDSCMRSARELADEVRPAALVHLELAEAIAEHANHVRLRSGLAIKVVEATPLPTLDEASRLVFFRAAQEALTNVVRHARASTVQISLGTDGSSIKMVVVDAAKPTSLGLLGLRERFEALGGGLAVTRESRGGTRLAAYLPSALPDAERPTS
jgi:PAS domain S-box-containing protein